MGKAPEGIRNTLIQVYLAVVKDATNPVGQRLGSVMQEGEQLLTSLTQDELMWLFSKEDEA